VIYAPGSDIFNSIEAHATQLEVPEMELFGMRLTEVLKQLSTRRGEVFDTNGWRQGLVSESRRKHDPWKFAALWTVLPRLRNMAWKVYHTTGLELDECRSALALGALEAMESVRLDAEDIGDTFVTLAAKSAWALGRGCVTALAELGWDGDELLSMPAEFPTTTEKIKQAIDARQYLLTPKQLAGERFGALAAKLGMLESLHRPDPKYCRAPSRSTPLDFIKLFKLPQFVGLKAAADMYEIGMDTAYQWIKLRKFRFAVFKEGRTYRIPTTSLALSVDIYMDEIDFDDVLLGANFAAHYYAPSDDNDPFTND
jgi:hypothetical protein